MCQQGQTGWVRSRASTPLSREGRDRVWGDGLRDVTDSEWELAGGRQACHTTGATDWGVGAGLNAAEVHYLVLAAGSPQSGDGGAPFPPKAPGKDPPCLFRLPVDPGAPQSLPRSHTAIFCPRVSVCTWPSPLRVGLCVRFPPFYKGPGSPHCSRTAS